VSEAKPKIADYPFTTLTPNLGVVSIGEYEFVLADIPGLVDGAADGRGLGHEFLRHAERARVLVILLDPTPLQIDSIDEQYLVLCRELEKHSPELAARPRIVVINKTDSVDVAEDVELGVDAHRISGITGDGVTALLYEIGEAVAAELRAAPDRAGYELHRPVPAGFTVTRVGDEWVVSGKAAERAVNLDDLTAGPAADFAARRLNRLGVDGALAAAGAVAGDDVRIGDIVFTYQPRDDEESQ
jgi:GTP-binding protein